MFTRSNIVRFLIWFSIVLAVLIAVLSAVLFRLVEHVTLALILAMAITSLMVLVYGAMHLYDSSPVATNAITAVSYLVAYVPTTLFLFSWSWSGAYYVGMFIVCAVAFMALLHETARLGGNAFLALHRNFRGAFRGIPVEQMEEPESHEDHPLSTITTR